MKSYEKNKISEIARIENMEAIKNNVITIY